jgi:hypothetical protein
VSVAGTALGTSVRQIPRVAQNVRLQLERSVEAFAALVALKPKVVTMTLHVYRQVGPLLSGVIANSTLVNFLKSVEFVVVVEILYTLEAFTAHLTLERAVLLVHVHVLDQCSPGVEPGVARDTNEGFLARGRVAVLSHLICTTMCLAKRTGG